MQGKLSPCCTITQDLWLSFYLGVGVGALAVWVQGGPGLCWDGVGLAVREQCLIPVLALVVLCLVLLPNRMLAPQ